MINLGVVISSPMLSQPFTIQRSTGVFKAGRFVEATTTIQSSGVITSAKEQDLEMVPEGDRVRGAMSFHSVSPIYETVVEANGSSSVQRVSDVLLWRGAQYRVLATFPPMPDYGYYRAIAVRMAGQ